MEVFTQQHTVMPEGLTTRELFVWLQDIAGEQCVPLHLSGPDLEERGLMWVVIRYRVEVDRWPQAGETVSLNTWPGKPRHGMMPRFYTLTDAAGEKLLAVSSVWAVVDRQTRTMVNNEEVGVHLDALVTGEEIRLPGAIRKAETTEERDFTVPADYLDSNGHMNNTRYYTVAESCIGRDARQNTPVYIATEHISEALCGEKLTLRWAETDGQYYVSGENGDKPVFRMNLRYR